MFKPNIRGVHRSALRFGLSGWKSAPNAILIQHRYPWRNNWVERLCADERRQPVLARSGQVYLVWPLEMQSAKPKGANVKLRFGIALLVGGVIAFVFAQAVPVPRDSPSQVILGAATTKPLSMQEKCSAALTKPGRLFDTWIKTGAAPEVAIQELQRQVFGGVQNRKIQIQCDATKEIYKLSLSLKSGSWQLKRFTRLEN